MIPKELREIPQWVNVSKGSKIPMQSTCRKSASSTNPETWSDFETANKSVESGYYDGVGFVLDNNGIVIVDIDDCVDGGVPNSFAMDIIFKLHSYTEISRSGTGIHIVCYGDIPFLGKNNFERGIEIYKDSRYIIITGEEYLFNSLSNAQEGIDEIINVYFSEEAVRGTTGSNKGTSARIYNPKYNMKHSDLKIDFSVDYPIINDGGRNHCLTSYAGQLRVKDYTAEEIYAELQKCNQIACKPPLGDDEIVNIVRSIMRYG